MSAVAQQPSRLGQAALDGAAETLAAASTGVRRSAWALPALLTAFWIYVMLSNVLYASGMSATLDPEGTRHAFARWDARVLQHVFLYPILVGCMWASLRVGWKPLARAVPIQILLGLFFSAFGKPFLWAGEMVTGVVEKMPHEMEKHWTLASMLADMAPGWIASATSFLITYGFALALVTGFALYRRNRDTELRLQALGRAWTAARLSALRMQLSPHTLFNLLHTIRGEIGWDPALAQSMIVQLADLLRRLLNAGGHEFARLAEELEFAQLYLSLQHRRFTDRLSVELPAPGSAPDVWVPSLILQPLIENAVVHGLAVGGTAVTVRIECKVEPETLVLRVTNTGAVAAPTVREGIGLANVRERLQVHFGERGTLSSGPSDEQTWLAQIRMPLLTAPEGGLDARAAGVAA